MFILVEMLEEHNAREAWLALIIGNTRLHWGWFNHGELKGVWHTFHVTGEIVSQLAAAGFRASTWQTVAGLTLDIGEFPEQPLSLSSLWVASAVPKQSDLWAALGLQQNAPVRTVERSHIPLANLYPTLGIDRAINLLGAGHQVGWPVLVIDAGTAVTFTAGTQAGFYGGAILPGVRMQGQALCQNAAALESVIAISKSITTQSLPERWAVRTDEAIASGLIYGILAILTDYLTDWQQQFPTGKAIFTGGDGPLLHTLLKQKTPEIVSRVQVDSLLMFWGMQAYRKALTRAL